jgi:hypothetical protein
MSMRILITGATGLIGKPLAKRLAERGHELVVLGRSASKARDELAVRCEIHAWDPEREPLPRAALQGVQAVIHLAGESIGARRWTDAQKRRIIDSRVKSARELLLAAAETRQVKVFISSSAIGYYGDRGSEELTETSAPGEGFLSEVCRLWEGVVREHPTSYQRAVMIRTGLVLSRRGGALEKMLPLFRTGLGGPMGDGRQWMSWIHLDDLVELYVTALENSGARGPINGVAPEPLTNDEFSRELGRALGRPALLRAPRFALRAALGEMADLVLQGQRVLPEAAQSLGFKFRYPKLSQALAAVTEGLADGDEEFETEQWIPKPVEQVFPYFREARNLETLMPSSLDVKILKQSSEKLAPGTLIDYSLTFHGVPLVWQARIESWEENRGFRDSQLKGPYRKWVHTHRFEPFQGGTLMRDEIRFRLPGGVLANKTVGIKVRKDIAGIFAHRKKMIREIFG